MEKRLATFRFLNGTEIRTVVHFYSRGGERLTFLEMFEEAKDMCWDGDEEHVRGRLMSFVVGDIIKLK